jgi:hypothetical protein
MTENIITIKKGAGKGDARRDTLEKFRTEYTKVKKGAHESSGVVTKTGIRTRIVVPTGRLCGRAVDVKKIRLHISLDIGGVQGVAPLLEACCGLGCIACIAVHRRCIELVTTRACCDSQIVGCFTTVILPAIERLILQYIQRGHRFS